MKVHRSILALSIVFAASAKIAQASCPASPPITIKAESADQKVSAAWLEKTLSGKKIKYKGSGTESYKPDGSYSYSENGKTWEAKNVRFYGDGTRCVGYEPNPRFDRYVVRDKKLILISGRGNRWHGQILK